MWNSATQNDIELPPMSEYGWERQDGKLNIVWDVPENITRVQERIEYILKGCRCKTGCQTRRYKCQRHKPPMKCGPGCHCTNCTNTHTHHTTADNPEVREIELREHLDEHQPDEYVEDSDTEQDEMKEDEELEEIMHFVFGSDHESDADINT